MIGEGVGNGLPDVGAAGIDAFDQGGSQGGSEGRGIGQGRGDGGGAARPQGGGDKAGVEIQPGVIGHGGSATTLQSDGEP